MVLLTGAAGFIGYHLAERLLAQGLPVTGVDNLDPYYDVRLKRARLARLEGRPGWRFVEMDLRDRAATESIFAESAPRVVVHLAAQAGVRHSLSHPHDYVSANVVAFLHVLEGCRAHKVDHLVFASSSSVYGLETTMPLSEHRPADHPVSLYAATKRSNELMAHSYAHLFGIPCTGLRFFTVYGPWGRPDMALFSFTKKILAGEPIQLFNQGQMLRDFTYVDDVVEAVSRLIPLPPGPSPVFDPAAPDPALSSAPFRITNIGNTSPVELGHFVDAIEAAVGKKALREYLPMQPGEVVCTHADVHDLQALLGWRPTTPLEEGVRRFVDWYRDWTGT